MAQTTAMPDIYGIVTNRIIELLKAGTIPWRKPWTQAGMPCNLISGRKFRGINALLLNAMGFEYNLFLTWKQIKTISASVRPGEKGTTILFYKLIDEKKDGVPTGKMKPFLRLYKVFNVAQCRDVPRAFFPAEQVRDNTPLWECERIVEHMPECPLIKHQGDDAYYVPDRDYVNMPSLNRFESSEAYYCALFHELVHSTGHQKRIGRKEVYENPDFGTEEYSLEELVAEMGSCYLQSHAGVPIEQLDNSAAYIQNWLQVFEGDSQFVIKAASYAQRAVDYILSLAKSSGKN